MDLHGLLPSISSKKIDLAIAAISITPERMQSVTFSIPYAKSNITVLFRKTDDFKSTDDLKSKIIGAALGTTWYIIASEISEKQNGRVVTLASNLMLVQELINKKIDAVIFEDMQVKKFIEKHPELASFDLKGYPGLTLL